MNPFQIDKQTLVNIVQKCQNRIFSDELDILRAFHPDPTLYIIKGLKTDAKYGIQGSDTDLHIREQIFGSNKKQKREPSGFFELFFGALEDFTMRILIVASFLSIAIQVGTAKAEDRSKAWIEGFAVLMAVIICASVTAVNDYQKQRQFLKLNSVADSRKRVTVQRKGITMQIHQDDVLVGDIIQLNQGMQIPADGYLIQSNEIKTDESAMTGQTEPISKNTFQKCVKKEEEIIQNGEKNNAGKYDIPSPIMLSGTRMLNGYGLMIVLVVGQQSCLGKIRALLSQNDADATPLQMKLQKIAEDIGRFGLYSAIGIVLILLIRFSIQKGISKSWQTSIDLPQLLNYLILGITVIVVAIPQGLPLSVTLSLAFSVKKMLLDNNLVRKMQACQTMGGANMICSDKTGTLTLNKMTLTSIWNGQRIDFEHYQQKLNYKDYFNDSFFQLFCISCCVNSTALLRPEQKGSSTQLAILKLMQKMKIKYEQLRQKYPTQMKFPFSSKRKRMSSIIKYNNKNIILVKGASQIVLQTCKFWYDKNSNTVKSLSNDVKQIVSKSIVSMAEQSLRTLCIAYKNIQNQSLETKDEKDVFDIEKNNFILLGVLGVKDVPRPEVPSAIQKCKKAGIKVRMVTGDNIITARAIAKQVGIIQQNSYSLVMEGVDFIKQIGGVVCKNCRIAICDCQRDSQLAQKNCKPLRIDVIKNLQQFKKITKNLDVLARSRPQDKYALVTGLIELGNVVAVTGDGTNDAPALKKADVGFAMGINGTQVARQAASIILLDDNFNSIVKGVMWGRNIYDSIKKFIQFQLTVNIVAVGITIVGAVILKSEILKPIQMLWINLIMDTLASLALATEPPTQQLLDRQPHRRDQYIISKKMFKHIIIQAIFQLTIMMILTFAGQYFIPESYDSFDAVIGNNLGAKYRNGLFESTVRSGRMHFIDGSDDYMKVYYSYKVFSRHFTFVFNTFVMLQIFNFMNCRKLNDEINIFSGLSNNPLFIIIIIIIFILQILLITFGSIAFGVYSYYGLNIKQWLLSIAFGSLGILINFLAKFIPQGKLCISAGNKQQNPLVKHRSSVLNLKRGSIFAKSLNMNKI